MRDIGSGPARHVTFDAGVVRRPLNSLLEWQPAGVVVVTCETALAVEFRARLVVRNSMRIMARGAGHSTSTCGKALAAAHLLHVAHSRIAGRSIVALLRKQDRPDVAHSHARPEIEMAFAI